ncbi:MAG: hypothetical protein JF616_02560 [Fibrobacteres bacterium]|nr:hypothetical protein [Fibrobacterota bacterium]
MCCIGLPSAATTVQGKVKELQVYSENNSEKPTACTLGNIYVLMDNNVTYWHMGSNWSASSNQILSLLVEAFTNSQTVKLEVEDAGTNCAPTNYKKILSVRLVKI